jgi:hypothetical protein
MTEQKWCNGYDEDKDLDEYGQRETISHESPPEKEEDFDTLDDTLEQEIRDHYSNPD